MFVLQIDASTERKTTSGNKNKTNRRKKRKIKKEETNLAKLNSEENMFDDSSVYENVQCAQM